MLIHTRGKCIRIITRRRLIPIFSGMAQVTQIWQLQNVIPIHTFSRTVKNWYMTLEIAKNTSLSISAFYSYILFRKHYCQRFGTSVTRPRTKDLKMFILNAHTLLIQSSWGHEAVTFSKDVEAALVTGWEATDPWYEKKCPSASELHNRSLHPKIAEHVKKLSLAEESKPVKKTGTAKQQCSYSNWSREFLAEASLRK